MKRNSLFVIVLSSLCAFAVQAKGGISVPEHFPTEGTPTFISVRDENGDPVRAAKVTVTYRPESKVEKTVDLGVTDEKGTIRWTPEDAGVVTIQAEWTKGETRRLSHRISVRFSSVPAGGVFIMVSAGLLLIGGSVIRFIRLIRSPGKG